MSDFFDNEMNGSATTQPKLRVRLKSNPVSSTTPISEETGTTQPKLKVRLKPTTSVFEPVVQQPSLPPIKAPVDLTQNPAAKPYTDAINSFKPSYDLAANAPKLPPNTQTIPTMQPSVGRIPSTTSTIQPDGTGTPYNLAENAANISARATKAPLFGDTMASGGYTPQPATQPTMLDKLSKAASYSPPTTPSLGSRALVIGKGIIKNGVQGLALEGANQANNALLDRDLKNGAFTDNASRMDNFGAGARMVAKGVLDNPILKQAGDNVANTINQNVIQPLSRGTQAAYDYAFTSPNELKARNQPDAIISQKSTPVTGQAKPIEQGQSPVSVKQEADDYHNKLMNLAKNAGVEQLHPNLDYSQSINNGEFGLGVKKVTNTEPQVQQNNQKVVGQYNKQDVTQNQAGELTLGNGTVIKNQVPQQKNDWKAELERRAAQTGWSNDRDKALEQLAKLNPSIVNQEANNQLNERGLKEIGVNKARYEQMAKQDELNRADKLEQVNYERNAQLPKQELENTKAKSELEILQGMTPEQRKAYLNPIEYKTASRKTKDATGNETTEDVIWNPRNPREQFALTLPPSTESTATKKKVNLGEDLTPESFNAMKAGEFVTAKATGHKIQKMEDGTFIDVNTGKPVFF